MTPHPIESRRAGRTSRALAIAAAAVLGTAAGCINPVETPSCVTDNDCGSGNACMANTCIPHAVAQGGTWAIDLVPSNDSSAATTRFTAVTFSEDVTVLSAEAKQNVTGTLAPGSSFAGASHMVALLQTAIPGYTDLKIEADSTQTSGAADSSFNFKVPTGALGRMATFRLIPLPPRDSAQPPVLVTTRLAPTVNLAYSSNFYFITGRLISPAQQGQSGYVVRAFEGGQLVSSVSTTDGAGNFRIGIPVDDAYPVTGQVLTVEAVSGADGGSVRFATPPFMLTNHIDQFDLTMPVTPATVTYRFRVIDPARQPVVGALVRAHTDVSYDRSGGLDFTRDGVTDAAGNVDMILPAGTSASPRSYDIAVAAPVSSRFGSACLSGFQINDQTPIAGTSGAIAASLSVPEKAKLPGNILSAAGEPVAAVSVVATRIGSDATAGCGKAALPTSTTSATSGRDGSFQLLLDPGSYAMDYDPPAGAPVPRLTENNVTVAAGSNGAHAVQLLPGALVKGAVRDAQGSPLPFAGVRFLEVACVGQDACFGANRVKPVLRGDTHADGDGMFRVVVPIPAQ